MLSVVFNPFSATLQELLILKSNKACLYIVTEILTVKFF